MSPSNTSKPVDALLRGAREGLGWTLVDLAEETGIPLRSLSRWENGGATPSTRSAATLIAAYLKIDADVGHALAAAFDIPLPPSAGRTSPVAAPPPALPAPPADPVVTTAPAAKPSALAIESFDASTRLAAEALGVEPARLRGAMSRLVLLWRAAGLRLEDVGALLEGSE